MKKQFDVTVDRSNPEKKAMGREAVTGRRFCNIALKTLALLFVFSLGISPNELYSRDRLDDEVAQIECGETTPPAQKGIVDNDLGPTKPIENGAGKIEQHPLPNGIHYFVYDTEQKVDDHWEWRKKVFFDETGLSSESPEMAWERKALRPLVEVGPYLIFHSVENKRSWFSVYEKSSHAILTRLASDEQSKELQCYSLLEKDWNFPRFSSRFFYSKGSIYRNGIFSFFKKDGTRKSDYFDTRGIGVLDAMCDHKEGKYIVYYLNGLTWKQDDRPRNETEPTSSQSQWLAGWLRYQDGWNDERTQIECGDTTPPAQEGIVDNDLGPTKPIENGTGKIEQHPLPNGIHYFVYDTEQKVDGYWEWREKEHFDRTGDSPESPERKMYMAKARKEWRPLVEVGAFFIFLCEEGARRWFTVLERSTHVLIVQLASDEQSKELRLYSSLEKDWNVPRFVSQFRYSEDGVYEYGGISVFRRDGTRKSDYIDTRGIGVLDAMYAHKEGKNILYYLNGLTWERDDEPLPDSQENKVAPVSSQSQWPAGWPR